MRKKFTQIAIDEGKFFSAVAFGDIDEIGDGTVDIEMLRVGTFTHHKYGELDITEEMLESMVENFKNGVIGREVSFDWNHKGEAASGWLKGMRVENGVLIGTTELTDEGKDSIVGKKYGYFSIEYNDDYEDPESGESHGPTVVGGALTNRPFMTKLKKIEFSLEDSDVSIYRVQEGKSMDKDVKRTPVKKTDDDDVQTQLEAANTRLAEITSELEETKKKLEETKKPDDKKLQEFIEAQQTQMKKLEDELKELKESGNSTVKKLAESEEKNRRLSVETTCEKLLRDDNHHPAVVGVAKEIMLSDISGNKVVKLTEKVGEGDEEKMIEIELSISDAIIKVLEAIPKSQRADYDEKTTTLNDVTLSDEEEAKLEETAISKAMVKKGLKVIDGKRS